MHERLVSQGGCGLRVRRLGGDRAGEIGLTRFLRNPAVTSDEMVSSAARGTAGRCAGRHVLVIQDTTVVRSSGGGGDYLHAAVAVDAADDAILGLVHAEHLSREAGRRGSRRQRPVSDKESARWLRGADRAAEVCSTAARVTVIADRESDIFEAFARRPAGTDLLVRAAHDRTLDEGGRLFARVDGLAEAGRAASLLPAKPGRRARDAVFAVRFTDVRLARPRHGRREEGPDSVALSVVDVREVAAPAGAAPVHWRLLTSHAVTTVAEAFEVVELYRRRWAIEQLFRTMKSKGFDIEGLRIEADGPRCRLVTATLIAAITIQQLVHARDGGQGPRPLRPLGDAFAPEDQPLLEAFCATLEGKTERQKNPHPKGSLAYAAWVAARLGGWTGYYGKPGPIVMLNGWLHFQAAKTGANLIQQKHDV